MKNGIKPNGQLKVREMAPKLNVSKEGAQILCPFCTLPHPLFPGKPSPCGTTLRVTAVQSVIPARLARLEKLVCLKCGNSGGEMVQYMNGFIHLIECAPGTKLLAEPPKFSRTARLVFGLPEFARKRIEKKLGRAQQVKEIDPNGKDTGKVLGYFFLKA